MQVCPKHCISFDQDSEGFRYPLVDETKCIHCGLCEKVCSVLNTDEAREPLSSYAAINENESERLNSSSGGMFIILAKHTIAQGGVVFGAKFDEQWNVVHAYSENEVGLSAFMGSKYVQSRIGETYTQAKEFLNVGRQVLFSGTPCQIAGLRKYLRKDYDNLITVDVICHGVPSPMVWQEYLREIKESARKGENTVSLSPNHSFSERDTLSGREDVRIESIAFRDKKLGWKNSVSLSPLPRPRPMARKIQFRSHIYTIKTHISWGSTTIICISARRVTIAMCVICVVAVTLLWQIFGG